MNHQLPPLPYSRDALAPLMSDETLYLHHGKHHATYIEKLNALVERSELSSEPRLSNIVRKAHGGIFNNGAQAWNHAFFWQCLRPQGGGDPSGALAAAIERDFGSIDALRNEFSNALITLFGSGWAWLSKDGSGKLIVEAHSNAGNPLTEDRIPILTCDMWEHAYYLDYRNEKQRYVEAFWQLVNWDFVADRLTSEAPYDPAA